MRGAPMSQRKSLNAFAISINEYCGSWACTGVFVSSATRAALDERRPGKAKKLYGGTMHKPKRIRVNYRLRPDVKESVEQIATDTGKTMTEVVENAVKLYVESIATNPAE